MFALKVSDFDIGKWRITNRHLKEAVLQAVVLKAHDFNSRSWV